MYDSPCAEPSGLHPPYREGETLTSWFALRHKAWRFLWAVLPAITALAARVSLTDIERIEFLNDHRFGGGAIGDLNAGPSEPVRTSRDEQEGEHRDLPQGWHSGPSE